MVAVDLAGRRRLWFDSELAVGNMELVGLEPDEVLELDELTLGSKSMDRSGAASSLEVSAVTEWMGMTWHDHIVVVVEK